MSCNFPIGVYRLDGSAASRPCGSCIQCRLEYAKEWAVRCVHEAAMHEENCFVTLTYNNENIPQDGSVKKGELTKFMKRLRREIEPKKVRFFGAGEYGEKLNRPHYHVCLFGYDFPDKKVFKTRFRSGKNVDMLYISKLLEEIWQKGFTTIGSVNLNSAGYVARYVTKKITGKKVEKHYGDKESEFALMSRMPGIGATWFDKYHGDVYPKDFYVLNGKKMRPPRYYDSLLEKKNKKLFQEIKAKRQQAIEIGIDCNGAGIYRRENDVRKMQKEKYRRLVTRRLERELENESDNNVCAL